MKHYKCLLLLLLCVCVCVCSCSTWQGGLLLGQELQDTERQASACCVSVLACDVVLFCLVLVTARLGWTHQWSSITELYLPFMCHTISLKEILINHADNKCKKWGKSILDLHDVMSHSRKYYTWEYVGKNYICNSYHVLWWKDDSAFAFVRVKLLLKSVIVCVGVFAGSSITSVNKLAKLEATSD